MEHRYTRFYSNPESRFHSQEEFRACADLRISSPSGWYDSAPNTDVDKDGSVQDLVRAEAGAGEASLSMCLVGIVTILILCTGRSDSL